MKHILTILLLGLASRGLAGETPLVLENHDASLRFEPRNGAWIGLLDRHTGDNLVVQPSARVGVAPAGVARLDQEGLNRALAEDRAFSLIGDWRYTPTPTPSDKAKNFIAGRFESVIWTRTPVPSRRGVGDDQLHNRTGDFWYRREFIVPSNWPDEPMALVIGAVDDFDVTWLNGTCLGSTGAETPHHWETARYYRIPARVLHRGQTNVLLIKVTNGAFDGGIAGPVAIGPESVLREPLPDVPLLTGHSLTRGDHVTKLRISARTGAYEYSFAYELPDDGTFFWRQLAVKNVSKEEQLFQTASYATPAFSVGSEQAVIFPGTLPVGDQPVARMAEGGSLRPRSQDPLVVLWDAQQKRGLGSWFDCDEEYAPVTVRRVEAGVEIRHTQEVIVRLQPGESVTFGREFFWLAHRSRDAALRGVQQVYRTIGLHAPEHGLSGLRNMVMYCGHPGGPPELGFLRYGGFKAMRAYVPTLHRMHIALLWFLPIWEHGDGKRWNLYAPFDHFQVDHLLGTADELKQLSRDCATNGIRLMFDLVPHGPPDFTPLAKEHPDWVARRPDGSFQRAWSQLAFDNHHPGWQDYFRRVAQWDGTEFGAVGARVDCGAGGPLNWNRAVTSRPSLSSLAGGLGMNRAIREGFLRADNETVALPEEYTGANIFYRVADLTYDAQFYFLQSDLLERHAAPEEWARAFQQFLQDQQETLPPGGLKMRWISNHDTVSWTFQKQRPARAYGLPRMRALLALCAFIEGVPMLYQGDEDPAVFGGQGESNVDFLARIYGLRKQLPALRDGAADYSAVHASGGVFACLRRTEDATALVLISFNPATTTSTVTVSSALPSAWTDGMTGDIVSSKGNFRVPMAPYQVRVLAGN